MNWCNFHNTFCVDVGTDNNGDDFDEFEILDIFDYCDGRCEVCEFQEEIIIK